MKKDWKKYKVSEILKPVKNYVVLKSETNSTFLN